jgi:preprotein translocase subunit SecG
MMIVVLNIIFLIASIGLIASVLMQSGKSAGLSGSIAGGAQSMFGKKKGIDSLLSKMTVVSAVLFMVLAIVLTSLIA